MFKIRPFEARTISWWYEQKDSIDTSPSYQRGGRLWNKEAKAFLVDSILNEFDIPKIYMADFSYSDSPLNDSNKQYALIDGKQRLEAIFDFFDGKICLQDSFVLYSNPNLSLGGLSYIDLKSQYPRVASIFDNFNLSVMSVITNESAKINELFLRLNSSKPLTGAEYRNAMQGVVPSLIREIADNDFFKEKSSFSQLRNADQQVAAKFLLVEFRGELTDTKKIYLDRLVAEGVNQNPEAPDPESEVVKTGEEAEAPATEFQAAVSRVNQVLENMNQSFTSRDSLLSKQGPLVIYYWFFREQGFRSDFREFLVNFEEEVSSFRRIYDSDEKQTRIEASDSDIARYISLSRNVNDSGSLVGRYSILVRKYNQWTLNDPSFKY